MKTIVKRILSCILFCALIVSMVVGMGDFMISKEYNRYYMLQREVARQEGNYPVQVFGACHSYTSFQAKYFEETYGARAYDYGNPSEIIPVTYLQMMEHFQKDVPKVALVEIWGINPYETYISQSEIFESFMPANIETLPISLEKIEVINDFDSVDNLYENFPLIKYKDRVLNMDIRGYDFDYSFHNVLVHTNLTTKVEMERRFDNNGFCELPKHLVSTQNQHYTPYRDVSDYYEKQAEVSPDDKLPLEEDILKYVQKIVDLCEKNDVQLIFYRAPYVSSENELRKANWFADYCESKNVVFFDLEKEMVFDVKTDFLDYEHLNECGAKKATDFLAGKILPYLG